VNQHAIVGTYVLMGVTVVVAGVCKAIEWANDKMKVSPAQRLR
jgi:glycosyltransferase A (GT-A) superfamily protein (DUF2064 family)